MISIDRVAHRLKLRDLRLLEAVVQWRSMAKAAAHLNLTQPAVSKAISELEHVLGVRLLDRSRQGIEPTVHGRALIRRGVAILDELRQGISEIEHLSDPAAGEVRVAAASVPAGGILPIVVGRLARRYPRLSIYVREFVLGSLQFHTPAYPELQERAVDMVLGPIIRPLVDDDVEVELLFDDVLFVAAGKQNPWSRRRAVTLEDLAEEPWCLPPLDSNTGRRCIEAFRGNGMDVPKRRVTAVSVQLQLGLLATEGFFTMFPGSFMRFGADRFAIKKLPIKLPVQPLPIGIVTLKDRAISPAAQLFIQTAREVAKPLANAR